jgi:hypothetical protein
MSTETPKKGHRHTRSAATPSAAASSQNPQNPHYLNLQAHAQNSELEMNYPIQPTTPPRTPRRDNQQTYHNKSSAAAPEHGSKQKPRNKNRPKNVRIPRDASCSCRLHYVVVVEHHTISQKLLKAACNSLLCEYSWETQR